MFLQAAADGSHQLADRTLQFLPHEIPANRIECYLQLDSRECPRLRFGRE